EIRDLLAYLRLVHNPNDSVSLERVLNTPPRGIGNKTQQELMDWANAQGVTPGVALLSLRTGATGPFSSRARKALDSFAELLAGWQALSEEGHKPLDILDAVIVDTGFEGYLRSGSEEGEDRWENVMELRNEATEHEDLTAMLTNVALVADVDMLGDEEEGPALMTLHSAKGLEFPVVFITGLEEGTLPHMRSIEDDQNGDPNALAEERRLLYVGLTRAQDRLYLTYAFRRARYGDYEPSLPSRFLHDLPEAALSDSPLHAGQGRAVSRHQQSAYQRMTAWADDVPTRPQGRARTTPHPDSPTPSARFAPGQRVSHPTFGEGIVIAARQYRDTEEVEVQFASSGRKRIDGSFLVPVYD
ncbi:MAG: ATP-binding domain-containing protein, partial [Anaerolineae bacterium]|nr:ATP-binding domain-containing protein [Anaerolineae bacterium]